MSPSKAIIRDLETEQQNRASSALDTMSALEIARVINQEDKKVAAAVEQALPQIAEEIDAIAAAIGRGGRLIYAVRVPAAGWPRLMTPNVLRLQH